MLLNLYILGSVFAFGCTIGRTSLIETVVITLGWPVIVPLYLLYVWLVTPGGFGH